jgi:hypothetical protein
MIAFYYLFILYGRLWCNEISQRVKVLYKRWQSCSSDCIISYKCSNLSVSRTLKLLPPMPLIASISIGMDCVSRTAPSIVKSEHERFHKHALFEARKIAVTEVL